jgi:hypothetical protein
MTGRLEIRFGLAVVVLGFSPLGGWRDRFDSRLGEWR